MRLRRPLARHGRLRHASVWSAVLRFVAGGLAVLLVSAACVAGIAVAHIATVKRFDLGDAPSGATGIIPSIGAVSGPVNLLLVGSDTRDGQKGHYGENPGSTLNDVNIVLHISADHTKATVISIPRDTYVDVPVCRDPARPGQSLDPESDVKINTTLTYGGVACVRDTVAQLLGIQIPYAAMITFDGVVEMSNAVGGVQVCVASAIDDQYTGLRLSKGEHTLQGAQALEFLRTRHGVGDGSDLTRISSQQVFLSSLVRKLHSTATLTDLTKLYGIAAAAADSMTLSTSLASVDTLVSIGRAVAPISLSSVVFVQYPTVLSGDGVVPDTSAATILMNAVRGDRSLSLKNSQGTSGSVISTPSASPSASASRSTAATPSASPSSSTVVLPSSVSGQTAAQQSCSVGNDLGTR